MANEAADATPASAPPRRSSRRESRASSPAPSSASAAASGSPATVARVDSGDAASAVAAPVVEQEPLDLSGGSTRRSRRQVKSTYATHTLASPAAALATAAASVSSPRASPRPSPRKAAAQSKEKKAAATKPEPVVVLVTVPIKENERISKRRRPNPSANITSSASASISANVITPVVVVNQAVAAPKVPAAQPDQSVKPEPPAQPPTVTQQVADTEADTASTPNINTEASTQAAPASPPRSSTVPAAAAVAAAPNSANRRRRPASRQTATTSGNAGNLAGSLASSLNAVVTPMGDADVSVRTQDERKVLGKYTGRECTLLCEAILLQIKRNSQDPKVLERDHSPAHIRWDKIAQKMLKAHRLAISPRDAQELWKFLAYAELPATRAIQDSAKEGQGQSAGAAADTTTAVVSLEDQLLPASDTEDCCQSVQTINEKYKKRTIHQTPSEEPQSTTTTAADQGAVSATPMKEEASQAISSDKTLVAEPQSQVGEATSTEEQVQLTEQTTADPVQPLPATAGPASPATKASAAPTTTHPSSRFRLYPAYDQPSGIPESWLKDKPFNVKETLPFTFVADKFLKKKPGAAVPSAPATTTTDSVPKSSTAAVATPAAPGQATSGPADGADKPKKKRVRKTENAKPKAAADGSTSGEPAKPKKPRATAQKSPAGSKATATQPKSPYVPSSTPPPQPLPPRAAFQFFCRMHEEEIAASAAAAAQLALSEAAATGTTTAAAPVTSTIPAPPVKKKTYFELQELFTSASLEVRNACQKLALEDLDRYNRECVRRRIWEKALSNSPVASPQQPGAITTTTSTATTTTTSTQPSIKPAASIPSLTVPVAIAGAPAPVTSAAMAKAPTPSAAAVPAPSTQ